MVNLPRAHASLKAAPEYMQYACGDFLPTCHNSDARFSELLAILIRVACNKSAAGQAGYHGETPADLLHATGMNRGRSSVNHQ